jgi:hypothetical protein
MKFTNDESGCAYENWTISIYRYRYGNKMSGIRIIYTFCATECIKDGNRYRIGAKVKGYGKKRAAIAEIKKIKNLRGS